MHRLASCSVLWRTLSNNPKRPKNPPFPEPYPPSRPAESPVEMTGLASDHGDSVATFSPDFLDPVVYPVHLGVNPPIFHVFVSWTRGNLLQVACLRPPAPDPAGCGDDGVSDEEVVGKVVEVTLGAGDGEIGEAQRRRIAYGPVAAFALLQSEEFPRGYLQNVCVFDSHRMVGTCFGVSCHINDLLGTPRLPSSTVVEDPKMFLQHHEEPTGLKAAWQLMEIFYVDKQSLTWLPGCLVD
ncbi:nuclear pore complex protein NUP85-like isoform X2 [Phoenix dactylifera]|nr:nuclear pore complex protein NUP85-like isoform X2 [Phoenix dactylifera]